MLTVEGWQHWWWCLCTPISIKGRPPPPPLRVLLLSWRSWLGVFVGRGRWLGWSLYFWKKYILRCFKLYEFAISQNLTNFYLFFFFWRKFINILCWTEAFSDINLKNVALSIALIKTDAPQQGPPIITSEPPNSHPTTPESHQCRTMRCMYERESRGCIAAHAMPWLVSWLWVVYFYSLQRRWRGWKQEPGGRVGRGWFATRKKKVMLLW